MATPIHLVFLGRADAEDQALTSSSDRISRLSTFIAPDGVEDAPESGLYISGISTYYLNYSAVADGNAELQKLTHTVQADGEAASTTYYLICRDSSITASTHDQLFALINGAKDLELEWHVFFLGKWMDNCSAHNESGQIGGANLVSNSVPEGFQAVLLSPTGAAQVLAHNTTTINLDLALNELIITSRDTETPFESIACNPNFFAYDPSYDDTASPAATIKTQECGTMVQEFKPAQNEDLAFFWFLVIVVIVCLLAWVMYKLLGTVDKHYSTNVVNVPVPALAAPLGKH